MSPKLLLPFVAMIISASCFAQTTIPVSEDLEIVRLSSNALVHVSYLNSPDFGKVPCNGLIYISGTEAIIMDTPVDDKLSKELLDWFALTYPGVTIKGVIINHFHDDCLGGLKEFHNRGIKSYAHKRTVELADADKATVPYNAFTDELKLKVGGQRVVCRYFGEAHTKDNIITWIPEAKLLFGGCMVKAIGAGKGNLADANVNEWANTVTKVKNEFGSQAEIVIPGHGEEGGPELLDYTIKMFSAN